MIIKSDLEIQKVLDFIKDNEHIAFDVETTSLNVRSGEIIGFGVSNDKEGFYIAHKAWHGDKLHNLVTTTACVTILNALQNKKLITFNGSFDTRFTLHYFNVNLIDSIWCDAMLTKHTVDEDQPFRLKDIAKKLYGADAAEEQRLMKESIKENGGTEHEYFKADLDIMSTYCIQDCLLTYRINEHYLDTMRREGLDLFYFTDEVMPFYKLVGIPMELHGVPVDVEMLTQAHIDILKDIKTLEKEIQDEIAPLLEEFNSWYLWKEFSPTSRPMLFKQALAEYADLSLPKTKSGNYSLTKKNVELLEDSVYKEYLLNGAQLDPKLINKIQHIMFNTTDEDYMFNLSSKDHLKRLFFDKLEENPVTKTDKGAPQVNEFFLIEMQKKYDWVRKLRNLNKLNKLNGTYIEGILEKQEDGVFYPSWFMHRTVSGRLGSNLQQLARPKEKGQLDEPVLKYNNMVRKFFIADTGYNFLDADYESLEPHVFAHVSGDQGLKDIFINGRDFYSEISIKTEKLEGVSADKKADNYLGKVDKQRRQKAKSFSLGIPYGLKDFALSKQLNIDQKEAQGLIDDYLSAFPELKKWMDISTNDCVTKGIVKSEAGRIRHMPIAVKIFNEHGMEILDSLKLWKKYHDAPSKYAQMKYLRKQLNNYINNSRNFQIQSLSASIVNRACIAIANEIKRKGIDGYICAQIHDQIIVRISSKDAKRFSKSMRYIMENVYKISLELKAPVEIGENFYETH